MDIFQTTDLLWKRYSRNASVIAIGQGGERLFPISLTLVDKIGSLGNKGGGAVFGSKNLKAVVVKGSRGVGVADPKTFMRLMNGIIKRVRNDPFHKKWIERGIMSKWPDVDWSYRNRDHVFPAKKANALVGTEIYLEKVKKGRLACPSCPYADKEILGVAEGEFEGLMTYSSGWARANEQFGIQCQVGGYDRVVKIFDMVQRYGLCRHAVSASVDYAVTLFEQGILTRKETGGVELKRDFETTRTLIEWMISGHALGGVLSRGPRGLAAAYHRDAGQELFDTKGTTITDDPRLQGLHTMNFEFIVNPKGHHSHCWAPMYDQEKPDGFIQGCKALGISEEAIHRIMDSKVGFNVGRLTKHTEDWQTVSNSLGLCQRTPYDGFWSLSDYCKLFLAATGIDLTPKEMLASGERSWNLLRMMNVRDGFSRKQDTYPQKWLRPLVRPNGEKAVLRNKFDGRVLDAGDLEQMIDDYYEERGWDKKTGIPKKAKLAELGLLTLFKEPEV
jgi:aldehyde:ferredoxin oxidoreductase